MTGSRLALLLVCGSEVVAAAASTDLIEAVKRQDRVAANAALDRAADVNATEGDGSTALHFAAQFDDLAMIELLLEAGADPNGKSREAQTPLMTAALTAASAPSRRCLRAAPRSMSRSHGEGRRR